jgi:hypothetical protein
MNAYRRQSLGCCGGLVTLLAIAGCGKLHSGTPHDTSTTSENLAIRFDASTCGTIRGRVTWHGDVPRAAGYDIAPNLIGGEIFRKRQSRPNPNAPMIDSHSKGVADAVVFLRGVDAPQSKPWGHPPVIIEQRDCQYHLSQHTPPSRFGFVRRGERITIVSRDHYLYTARASGAEFFSLTFPDPEQPLERQLSHEGVVELTSGVGYYWMRAYLFVTEHPYYSRTGKDGRFELAQVPAGHYEVVCWLPNWLEQSHDRDPESRLICRLYFKPAVEKTLNLTLAPGGAGAVDFAVTTTDFETAVSH